MNIRIRYNAPITLTYSLVAAVLLFLATTLQINLIPGLFMVPGRGGFDPAYAVHYVTLFTHVLGHVDWTHLMGNLAFILLLGPILEEKHGSFGLFIMILITAVVTGVLNILIFPSSLLGGSGIVFMMILLSSFTNIRNGEIPLTFILILILYLATEIINAFRYDDISQFAHIVGGICGSLFGFMKPRKR